MRCHNCLSQSTDNNCHSSIADMQHHALPLRQRVTSRYVKCINNYIGPELKCKVILKTCPILGIIQLTSSNTLNKYAYSDYYWPTRSSPIMHRGNCARRHSLSCGCSLLHVGYRRMTVVVSYLRSTVITSHYETIWQNISKICLNRLWLKWVVVGELVRLASNGADICLMAVRPDSDLYLSR